MHNHYNPEVFGKWWFKLLPFDYVFQDGWLDDFTHSATSNFLPLLHILAKFCGGHRMLEHVYLRYGNYLNTLQLT